MRYIPVFPADRLTIIAWPDEFAEGAGHDARAAYIERYWLGVLGPTATWLLRRIADELEASPNGFVMDVAETAKCIGVGGAGPNSPFMRALGRLVQFDIARAENGVLAVRRRLPSLSRRHLMRLPETVQQRHDYWLKSQLNRAS